MHAAEEVAYALQRQSLHGDRDKELVDVEQTVDVEDVPRGRRVEEHEVVSPQVLEGLAQNQLGAHIHPGDHSLRAGERSSASNHEQVLAGFYLYVSQAGVALQQI